MHVTQVSSLLIHYYTGVFNTSRELHAVQSWKRLYGAHATFCV